MRSAYALAFGWLSRRAGTSLLDPASSKARSTGVLENVKLILSNRRTAVPVEAPKRVFLTSSDFRDAQLYGRILANNLMKVGLFRSSSYQ